MKFLTFILPVNLAAVFITVVFIGKVNEHPLTLLLK